MQKKQTQKKNAEPVAEKQVSTSNAGRYLLLGAIAIITFIAFSPALRNSFVNWDDNFYVFENSNLGKPLPEAIKYFLQLHSFIGNYIPVTMITYALEYHAAGLDAQLFHSVNLVLHVINVILVFWFIFLLSGRKTVVAALVALFFGIHPMHVESVAWVAELKDVLFSMFFLGGSITYLKYLGVKAQSEGVISEEQQLTNQQHLLRLGFLTFVFLVFSTLSKPAAVVFPLMMLTLDFYTRRKFDKGLLLEKIPFFIVSVLIGVLTIKTQQADRLLHDYYPLSQRLFFAAHSLIHYLVKLFLPFNLSIFYPYPKVVNGMLPVVYYAAPLFLAGLAYVVYRSLKYTRLIAFGFLFYFVNIVLVIQLISVGDAIVAERYTYLPYIGLFYVLAMGFDWLYNTTNEKWARYKNAALSTVVVLALLSAYMTYDRCAVWENDDTIATDLINKYPNDRLALNNKGFILQLQKNYDAAIPLFNRAIAEKPDYAMPYINLVNTYIYSGDPVKAMATVDRGLKVLPTDFNLLNAKGYLLFKSKQYNEAIGYYKKALQAKKENLAAYIFMGACYNELKENATWMKVIDDGLKLFPDSHVLLSDKGYSLFIDGKYDEAVTYYKASLKINPDYKTAIVNLENCYKAMEQVGKARK